MPEEEKLVFEGEYEEKPLVEEKSKPKEEKKVEIKPKPKPKVEKVSKVDLKETIKKCDNLYNLVFNTSGGSRWDGARKTLAEIKKDLEDKLKE